MKVFVDLPRRVLRPVHANSRLQPGAHTPVDASAGSKVVHLPDASRMPHGSHLSVEKWDSSEHEVKLVGHVWGKRNQVLHLSRPHQSIEFRSDSRGSWWPLAGLIGGDGLLGIGAGVDVRTYGAVGDDRTDDTAAIQRALSIAASWGVSVYVSPGTYKISGTLNLVAPLKGAGANSSKIVISPGWAGSQMVDFYRSPSGLVIEDIAFDASRHAGVSIFGSSHNGQGGALVEVNRCSFRNTAGDSYAVDADSLVPAPGMLTGSLFRSCTWYGCARWVRAGRNQDDITFQSCRFVHDPGNVPTDVPMVLLGNNITFQSSFFGVASGNFDTSGVRALIRIGIGLVAFRGTFVESVAGSNINYTHLFWPTDPGYSVVVDGLRLNLSMGELYLFRAAVEAINGMRMSLDVRGLQVEGDRAPARLTLVDLHVGPGLRADQYLRLTYSHVEAASETVHSDFETSRTESLPVRESGLR